MERQVIRYARPLVELMGGLNAFIDRKLGTKSAAKAEIDWRAKKLKEFIDRDPGQGRTNLDELCKNLGLCMSARQARRLFRRSVGLGIRSYARNRRLSVAVEQLESTDTPVKAIAAELGFHSTRQFRRRFKEFFSLSPLEFRKATRIREF
jgi:transcriptional regulator GlxA family with amidase domain